MIVQSARICQHSQNDKHYEKFTLFHFLFLNEKIAIFHFIHSFMIQETGKKKMRILNFFIGTLKSTDSQTECFQNKAKYSYS
jgi:hypothetical protein